MSSAMESRFFGVFHVLRRSRQPAENRADRRQFRRGQVDVGAIARDGWGSCGSRSRAPLRWPPRAPGCPCTANSLAFRCAHRPRRRCCSSLPPSAGARPCGWAARSTYAWLSHRLVLCQQFAGGAEVPDVGHATEPMNTSSTLSPATADSRRASSGSLGAQTMGSLTSARSISMIAAYSASASASQQAGIGQPVFHFARAALQGARIAVTFGDHRAQQHDVGAQVFADGVFVQRDRATGGGAFRRGIGQFKCLLDGQVARGLRFPGCDRRRCSSCPSSRRSAGPA